MKLGKKALSCILVVSLLCTIGSVFHLVTFAETAFTAAKFSEDFLNADGTFNVSAEGFPANYAFDFTATTMDTYKMQVSKKFFHAVKESGQTVTLVDNIGAKYLFKAADIVDIAEADFATKVPVGGRYRDTSSYVTVGLKIAKDNMGIDSSVYVHKVNFGFVQVETGSGIASNCEIRLVMNFNSADNSANALGFYNAAANNSLYVYQYSSSALTTRATAKAVALTSPEIAITKPEAGEFQFMFSDRPLRAADVPAQTETTTSSTTSTTESTTETPSSESTTQSTTSPTTSTPPAPAASSPYQESFVSNGQFVTTAEGFPSDYIFTFGSYTTASPAFKKDLFQAIKNSGRVVTLIDRTKVSYVFDGSKMSDLSAETRNELFQLQSLYKTTASYQTVMGKIAGLSKISDGFYMNQDYIILDVQPETTGLNVTVSNQFPTPATIQMNLTNGVSGTSGTEIAERFAKYAQDGVLKAYFYDKTSTVQDIFVDKTPLNVTLNSEGKITFTVTEPCTLIFTQKDLLTGRQTEAVDTNPYGMRIKKDGKNMSDGYTMELGDAQIFDLSMENGNINDYTYEWDVIGPGAADVTIEPAPDSNNLSYIVRAVKESDSSKPFQVRVRIVGETNNFIATGTTTVVDSIFGKNVVENGKFNTSKTDFPADYVFSMSSTKYQITGEFLNAIAASKTDVTIIDSSNVSYIFHGAEMDLVDEADWATTYPLKALYKDSTSYQNVMLSIAYQYGYTEYVNNQDYMIIDFQAHGFDVPNGGTDVQFQLVSKSNDAAMAKVFADAYRAGKLYTYAYSKTSQNIYKPFKGLSLIEGTDTFTMFLDSPITLVFSTKELMEDITDDNASKPTVTTSTNASSPATGSPSVLPVILFAAISAGAVLSLRRKSV